MTKTLTEQWREGTLPKGWYYVKTHCEEIKKLYCGDGESLELDDPETSAYYFYHRENGSGQVEVLAPVPSYDEFVQQREFVKDHQKVLIENMNLKRKLEIATKALEEYAEEGNWCDCSDWNDMVYQNDLVRCCENGMFGEDGFKPAQKALKEMEGVK